MSYVLVVITVFSTTAGVASDTRFEEFGSRAACERAEQGIRAGIQAIPGTLAREVVTACFPRD
jgi:hypothetical protein